MNRDELLAKRDAIAKEFDRQQELKVEAESEQLRLQGEHRLVNELIDKYYQDVEEVA